MGGMSGKDSYRYSIGSDESPAVAVIQAIAARENISPAELSPSLYDALDPDALDGLFERSSGDPTVYFECCGWEVELGESAAVIR